MPSQENCAAPDWQRELVQQWTVHREISEREHLLASFEDRIAQLTESEQEALFAHLSEV
jgi:DNA-binding transcriptional regulator YbjK